MVSDDPTPCDNFGEHEIVFIGTAGAPVRRSFVIAGDLTPLTVDVVPLTIERRFRGVTTPIVYVMQIAAQSGLKEGRSYLLYGEPFGSARDLLNEARIQPIETAVADLAFLDSAAQFRAGATIHGVLSVASALRDDVPRTPLGRTPIQFFSGDAELARGHRAARASRS